MNSNMKQEKKIHIRVRCPACQKGFLKQGGDGSWSCETQGCGFHCADFYGAPDFYHMSGKGGEILKLSAIPGDPYLCPECHKGHLLPRLAKNGYVYWKCTNRECHKTRPHDYKTGMPAERKPAPTGGKRPTQVATTVPCPVCKKGHLVYFTQAKVYKCSDPDCHTTCLPDKNRAPDMATVIHDFRPYLIPGTRVREVAVLCEKSLDGAVMYKCPFCKEGYLIYMSREDGEKYWRCSSSYKDCGTYCSGDEQHPDLNALVHKKVPYIGIPAGKEAYLSIKAALSGKRLTIPEPKKPKEKMAPITGTIEVPDTPKEIYHCPDCGAPLAYRTNKKKQTHFWGCSRFPDCPFTAPDVDGNPDFDHAHSRRKKKS